MGKIVFISVSVVIKAGDTIGSNPQFSLPIAGIKFGNLFNSIGTFNFSYVDQGIRIYQGQVYPTNYTSDKVPFAVSTSNEQYLGSVDITSIVPFTFGNGDQLNCFGWYIAE